MSIIANGRDKFMENGISMVKSIVYCVQPGVEGEIFGLQTIYNALKCGGTGVFVVSSTAPDAIKSKLKELGWDIDLYKNRLFFVDAYNPLIGVHSEEKYIISNPEMINDFSKIIINLLKQLPPSTIVFGSLSTIMDLCGEEETIESVRIWNKMAAIYGHVMVYNFTAWPYSQGTLRSIKDDLFNIVVSIEGLNDSVIFCPHFRTLKAERKKEIWESIVTTGVNSTQSACTP